MAMDLFGEIKGQKGAVKRLAAQLKSGEFSHAYLFVGPEGTGKEFLARLFSKYLLCDDLRKPECPSCQKFGFGTHPDFIFIDGKEGIKIEQVREAMERIYLSPNMSKRKVLLVSKAEKMGNEAANALLKTFEEPPLDSVIILTAVSEESLPKTIISRAQVIKLRNLTEKELTETMAGSVSKTELEEILKFSKKNLGDVKALIENPEQLSKRKLLFSEIEKIVKGTSIIEKFLILEKHDKDKDLKEFFQFFSYVVFASIDDGVKGKEGDLMAGVEVAKKVNISKKILKIYENLQYNVNLRLALEQLILENF
jgi:DNA polymerase III delta' subunit